MFVISKLLIFDCCRTSDLGIGLELDKNISEELISFLDKPMIVPAWPCNTQAVEKAIADLNVAASHVRGEEGRDGLLYSYTEGRRVLPKHGTKRDYDTMIDEDITF